MQKKYPISYREMKRFQSEIEKFREEIYFYCDLNRNEEHSVSSFPFFRGLWPEPNSKSMKKEISRRDLTVLTSSILDELIEKGVLGIVHSNTDNGYAFYRILDYDNDLIDHRNFIDSKRALKFR
jgi:hypothetical protein